MKEALQGFAQACKSRISKRFPLLQFAVCCTVLRSRWCQSGIKTSVSYGLTAGPMRQAPTLGATIRRHRFLGVAVGCRIGLSKPISFLVVARRFRVLRSQWCQQWCQMAPAPSLVPMGLVAPRTSPGPSFTTLGSTPILVTPCGYSVGPNGRSLGVGEVSISVLDY
jgi:hypothetical protein